MALQLDWPPPTYGRKVTRCPCCGRALSGVRICRDCRVTERESRQREARLMRERLEARRVMQRQDLGAYLREIRIVLGLAMHDANTGVGTYRNSAYRVEQGEMVHRCGYRRFWSYYRRLSGESWPLVRDAARAVIKARREMGIE